MSPPAPATDRWKAWDAFLEATPDTGFMQSSWWADFRVRHEIEHFAVILKDRNSIVGGALVLKYSYTSRRCFYYIPEGPVLVGDESMAGEVFEAILEAIDERRKAEKQMVSHLRIEPRWQQLPGFVRGFLTVPALKDYYMEPRFTLCIDLLPSDEAILARMKPKARYNIGVARRHGVSVLEETSDHGLADFLSIYADTAARQGLEAKPPDYFQALVSILSSRQRGSIFFAEHRGQRLAAALVLYFGRRATYLFGGSLASERHVMAPYLLHFEIMRRARSMGHEWYDLYGVAPENEPDHPWQNISVFKRKFGGRELNLVPTLDYAYDPLAYNHYLATNVREKPRGARP